MGNALFPSVKTLIAIDISFATINELYKQMRFLNPGFSLEKWSVSNVVGEYSSSKKIIERRLETCLVDYFKEHKKELDEAKIDLNKINRFATDFIGKIFAREIMDKIFDAKPDPVKYLEDILAKEPKCFKPDVAETIKTNFYNPFSFDTVDIAEQQVLTDKLHKEIMNCIKDKAFFNAQITSAIHRWKDESNQFKNAISDKYRDASERYEAIRNRPT